MSGRFAIVAVASAALAVTACQSVPTRGPIATARPAPPVRVVRAPSTAESAQRGCIPKNLPPEPRYPDTDQVLLKAGGAADRYQLIAAGRLLRIDRLGLLERLVAGCR